MACVSPSAVASTSVFVRNGDGTIVDADIQLNALTVKWSVADLPPPQTDQQDLQAALTHELGHLLGLQHPCWSGVGPRPADDRGQPVPDCYDAPAEIQRSVMFPSTTPGDVSKRNLDAEDRRAVCELYPLAAAPPACPAPPPAGGCAYVRPREAGAVPWLVLAWVLPATLRRCGSRRGRSRRSPRRSATSCDRTWR
jgi:hypothetical protein